MPLLISHLGVPEACLCWSRWSCNQDGPECSLHLLGCRPSSPQPLHAFRHRGAVPAAAPTVSCLRPPQHLCHLLPYHRAGIGKETSRLVAKNVMVRQSPTKACSGRPTLGQCETNSNFLSSRSLLLRFTNICYILFYQHWLLSLNYVPTPHLENVSTDLLSREEYQCSGCLYNVFICELRYPEYRLN